tara:strand:- start:643 stop:1443 length:801 start_codon:yes stop_codon:yes gene_type:complete
MAVQYSLSYDAQGNPSLVKNTTTGSAPVIKTDNFTVGEYTPKRSIMTDFDFEDAFSPEQQYKILQTYIKNNDSDFDNEQNANEQLKFLKQSFEAAAARDDKGKVIGGLTFKEKLKMTAVDTYVDAKLNPLKSLAIGSIPFIGPIYKASVYAGSKFVDSYYDPAQEDYYYTGFGAVSEQGESIVNKRMEKAGGVKIDDEYMYGSDYQGSGNEAPSKTPPPAPSKPPPGHPEYNISQGGGRDYSDNKSQEDRSPGSTGPGGSDVMGSF